MPEEMDVTQQVGGETPDTDPEVQEQIAELFEEASTGDPSATEEVAQDEGGGEQPAEEKPTAEAEGQQGTEETEATKAQDEQKPEPQPEPVVTIDGRRYTREELAQAIRENPDFARALATRAEQTPHWQRKYEELRAALMQQGAQQQPSEEQPAGQAPTPEEIKAAQRAAFEQIKVRGEQALQVASEYGVEPEFTEFYPEASKLIAGWIAQQQQQIAQLSAVVSGVAQERLVAQARQIVEEAERVVGSLDEDAPEEMRPFFEPLRQPEERNAFLRWLDQAAKAQGAELPLGILQDRELLRKQYLAFRGDAIAREAAEARRLREEQQKRAQRASGRGTTGTAGVPRRAPAREELGYEDLFEG